MSIVGDGIGLLPSGEFEFLSSSVKQWPFYLNDSHDHPGSINVSASRNGSDKYISKSEAPDCFTNLCLGFRHFQ